MRFCSLTLGCKVNQYETQAIESILLSRGHSLVKSGGGCDVCIINTCAVTGESARKSAQAIRRIKKQNPGALIAVCGCYSQLDPDKAPGLGADLVGGSGGRQAFADDIDRLYRDRQSKISVDDPVKRRVFEKLPSGSADGRTRAMLKIQDGCDNFCAYCIIPYARGRVRSLPIPDAADSAEKLKDSGYREIVVTGIEIASYGKDLPGGQTLAGVIRAIGGAAPGVRLRLGSLSPAAITEDFCRELTAVEGLCNHFHLSLQSGCDETLKRMGRSYDTGTVYGAAALLREHFPNCGITADLIAGFPGETDAEFCETLEFIKRVAFSDMHIFPFSERPGTPAAKLAGQIEKSVRRARAEQAGKVADGMSNAFKNSQIGKTAEVLFERERDGYSVGHSRNYLEIAASGIGHKNSVHSVQITAVKDGIVWGEIL